MNETPEQKRETEIRQILSLAVATKWLPILSMVIAIGSLIASISQSYNYRKNIETVQLNVLRGEHLKTCRDVIEVFFAFRLRAEETNARFALEPMDKQADALSRREMKALVYRFGALGTYLANFSPQTARERYAQLSWQLNAIADTHAFGKTEAFTSHFAAADTSFNGLNEDCVRNAHLGN